MSDPISQFEIKKIMSIDINGIDLSFTNSSLWMVIGLVSLVCYFYAVYKKKNFIPSLGQAFLECMYDTVKNMIINNVGKNGIQFLPFVLTLFIFVLLGNLLGLIPGAFTYTSHIAVTFFLSFFIFISVTCIGIYKHGLKFFGLFFPSGAPLWTAVILVPIEIVSYFSRPVSLGVRLFANMVVGHVLLKVMAGFVVTLGGLFFVSGLLPLVSVMAITVLEILVAIIQAYVFAILTTVYLNDAINLH